MTDSPASSPEPRPRTVPADAPRPTATWLAQTLIPFLAIYFQPDESDPVFEAALEMWKAALADLPKDAIAAAIMDRLRSPDRRRPIPGEIRTAALSFVSRHAPQAAPMARRQQGAWEPDGKPVVSADRAAELVRETGVTSPAVLRLVETMRRAEDRTGGDAA